MDTWIRTYTGKRLDYVFPTMDQVDIVDIAHALSQICRFSGQSPALYTVAQHSVYVSHLASLYSLDPKIELAALLHDATEAYMADIPSPLKALLPDYVKLETNLGRLIYTKYGVGNITYDDIKHYDKQALNGEFTTIIGCGAGNSDSGDWPAFQPEPTWSPEKAKSRFIERFCYLMGRIHGF